MRFTLLVSLFALAGCPDPVDPNVPGGGAPGGELAPMGPNGGAPPDGAPVPAADGVAAAPTQPEGTPPTPPGLASLVKDGAVVTIKGTLEGAKKAQVDFQFYSKDAPGALQGPPENVEIVQVTDGTFSVKAPATSDAELYITATAKQGEQPAPSDPSGFAGPLTLAGKDLAVTIKLAPNGASKLPWFRDADPTAAGAAPGSDGMAPMNGAAPAAGSAAPAAGAAPVAPAAGSAAPAAPAKGTAAEGNATPTPASAPAAPKSPASPKSDAKAGKAPAAPK